MEHPDYLTNTKIKAYSELVGFFFGFVFVFFKIQKEFKYLEHNPVRVDVNVNPSTDCSRLDKTTK